VERPDERFSARKSMGYSMWREAFFEFFFSKEVEVEVGERECERRQRK